MNIEDGLVAHLLADSPVAALVVARVYPDKLPQSPTYPAITYEIISDIPYRGLSGDHDKERVHARLHCWAVTAAVRNDLTRKVRAALSGFKGLMGTVKVSTVKFETWNDIYEDEPEVYRRVADFMVTHA